MKLKYIAGRVSASTVLRTEKYTTQRTKAISLEL